MPTVDALFAQDAMEQKGVTLYATPEPKVCEWQCETDPSCHGFVVETSFKVRTLAGPAAVEHTTAAAPHGSRILGASGWGC